MKRILDSVHGYITIDKDYCKNIIDTEHFQRLRRIEQTSSRTIFPSARHDRFIHSLGVYHLGCQIVERVKKQLPDIKDKEFVYESYRLACLLHDVAHAPFSHTFEDYYDNQWSDLQGKLCKMVGKQFTEDWANIRDPSAPHEKMSAIVALGVYGTFIEKKGDKELVARMITGVEYSDKINYSFENAMINLIHGEVIDADGLDYVCRDTWAAGYSTAKVDVERLINSITITKDKKDKDGIYQLCYTAKCLNEIEAVLKIKTFQQFYVINHHIVIYEQELLKEAMKSAAFYHYCGKNDEKTLEKREKALQKLCDIKSFYNDDGNIGVETTNTSINVILPMDDDFVFLMKYVKEDKYVKQWLTREYKLKALWKSKAIFSQLFKSLRGKNLKKENWDSFENNCKKIMVKQFNISEEDVWVISATPKYKGNYAKKVKLFVNDDIISYEELFPFDVHSYEPPISEFRYLYIPSSLDENKVCGILREKVNELFGV